MQQPCYPNAEALRRVVEQLAHLPPLVTSWEIETLKSQLAEAAAGKRFLLQGGDCAETFDDCESSAIANKLKILLQMSLVLVHGMRKRVIRVGRFAGQYAKPRSNDVETRTISELKHRGHGEHRETKYEEPSSAPAVSSVASSREDQITLPSYRGDIVNRPEFTVGDRTPDPLNMLRAYERSALTLNFIRALIDGGFADLHHPEYWDLGFVKHSPRADEYQHIVESIGESLRFMEVLAGQTVSEMTRVDFFTSHEALILLYEQAQTRQVPRREGWYNLSTHFPWIGMRTATPESAHVEYARGIRNPIAIKVGTPPEGASSDGMSAMQECIAQLLEMLNPEDEPGRLTIVHRFGAHQIAKCLPRLIEAVDKSSHGKNVLFVCDPMHGNTQSVNVETSKRPNVRTAPSAEPLAPGSAGGNASSLKSQSTSLPVKTRKFEHILAELEQAFDIHKQMGTYLGGVHFELTGDNVTECTGGARGMSEADLSQAYKSHVDPRLNYEQSLEMALLIARLGR
jgi:3-deoxy-7-phosphoheptulonate synthase